MRRMRRVRRRRGKTKLCMEGGNAINEAVERKKKKGSECSNE